MPEKLKKTNKLVHSATLDSHMPAGHEECKEILLKIYKNTQKTRRYILIGRIISLAYLLLILGFFAVGLRMMSPLLKQFNNIMMPYQELLGNNSANELDVEAVNNLLQQYQR